MVTVRITVRHYTLNTPKRFKRNTLPPRQIIVDGFFQFMSTYTAIVVEVRFVIETIQGLLSTWTRRSGQYKGTHQGSQEQETVHNKRNKQSLNTRLLHYKYNLSIDNVFAHLFTAGGVNRSVLYSFIHRNVQSCRAGMYKGLFQSTNRTMGRYIC